MINFKSFFKKTEAIEKNVHKFCWLYRKIQPDSADIGAALADGVGAGVVGHGREGALRDVRAILLAHATAGQSD